MPKPLEIKTGDWTEWKVGPKKEGANWDNYCRPINKVSHSAHLRQAVEIAQDRQIRSGLVRCARTPRERDVPILSNCQRRMNGPVKAKARPRHEEARN